MTDVSCNQNCLRGLNILWESALAFSLMFAALPVLPGRTALVYSRRTPLVEHATVSLQSISVMLAIH
jgi:hypothetical protein